MVGMSSATRRRRPWPHRRMGDQTQTGLELDRGAATASRNPSSASRGDFIGRTAELEVLLGGIEDAHAGRGHFFAVVGDAGMGKTRTLEEFAARTGLADDRILWGRCPEHPGLPAYWPWTQAIGSHLERRDDATLR